MSESEPENLKLGFNAHMMLTLIADQYPSLLSAAKEAVQNALDAGASRVLIEIDERARLYAVLDNGRGCSLEEMTFKFKGLGTSLKSADLTSLGKFGIGLVSFYGKCAALTFTSAPVTADGNSRKTYHLSELVPDAEGEISFSATPDPVEPGKAFWWRTRLMATGIDPSHDMRQLTPARLREAILEAYELKILETGCKIEISHWNKKGVRQPTIAVDPREGFTGKSVARTSFAKAGITLDLDIYVAAKAGDGVLYLRLDEGTNRYKLADILEDAVKQGSFDAATAKHLNAGWLEGHITVIGPEIQAGRTRLTNSSATAKFFVALAEWYKSEGSKFVDAVLVEERDKLHHDMLRRVVDDLIGKDSEWVSHLLESLPSTLREAEGGRSFPSPDPTGEGNETPPAERKKQPGISGKGRQKDGALPRKVNQFLTAHDGPGSGKGIRIVYGEMAGSRQRYEFRHAERLIMLNRRHRDFRVVEDSASRLEGYIRTVLGFALARDHIKDVEPEAYGRFEDLAVMVLLGGIK